MTQQSSSENVDSLDGAGGGMVFAMNRALVLTLFFVACGPEQVDPEQQVTTPPVEEQQNTDTTTTTTPLTGFPCDVREVLQKNCARCHAGLYVTNFQSRSDLLQLTRQGNHELGVEIALRLRPGASAPMPPTGEPQQPTLAERQLIDGWVQSGMPAGACGELVDN